MFEWTRFWCPFGDEISLDEGFLLDPLCQLGQLLNKRLVSTASLPAEGGIILLGEAGSGKSYEVSLLAKNQSALVDLGGCGSEQALEREVQEALQLRSALYLDGLDEALLGIPKAAETILRCLKRASPRPRRVVLSCRTGAWPFGVADSLKKVLEADVQVWELAVLRRNDVRLAAAAHDLVPDDFMNAVQELRIEALATNPVSLNLLLSLYRKGTLPKARSDLYEQGLLCLCEQSTSRQERFGVPTDRGSELSPAELFAAATHISGVMMFSGHSTLSKESLGARSSGSLGLEEVSQGVGAPSLQTAKAVLAHAGLFSGRQGRTFGFVHKSYAEYLAARFVRRAQLPEEQVAALLFVAEESPPRVIPQLHETAAWLADMDAEFRAQLLRYEPGVLLRSDLRAQPDSFKRDLVAALLDGVRDERVADLADAVRSGPERFGDHGNTRQLMRGLEHCGLAEQLKNVIEDGTMPVGVRIAAIEIAESCDLRALGGSIARVAATEGLPLSLRITAAHAASRIADDAHRHLLKHLALMGSADDSADELKGIALAACWPGLLSVGELLQALTVPKKPSLHGAYRGFLRDLKIGEVFATSDVLPKALAWAKRHPEKEGRRTGLEEIASITAFLGWQRLDQPGVLDALADLMIQRTMQHSVLMLASEPTGGEYSSRAAAAALKQDPARRRVLLAACISKLALPADACRFTWGAMTLALPEDFEWAIENACLTEGNGKLPFAHLARSLCVFEGTGPWRNPSDLDLWLEARQRSSAVEEVMNWATETLLPSEFERAQRREWKREKALERRMMAQQARRRSSISRAQHIAELLRLCLSVDIRWFPRLALDLGYDDDGDSAVVLNPARTDGWRLSDPATRQSIAVAALRYLAECPTVPSAEPNGDHILSANGAAHAAILLWGIQLQSIVSLDAARVRLIASILLDGLCQWRGHCDRKRRKIAQWLLKTAPDQVHIALMQMARKACAESSVPEGLALLRDRLSADALKQHLELIRGELRDSAMAGPLLRWLVGRQVEGAVEYAQSLLPTSVPESEMQKRLAKQGACALVARPNAASWAFIWSSVTCDASWGDELIKAISPPWGESSRYPLHTKIGDVAAGTLAELLMKRFGPERDRALEPEVFFAPDNEDGVRAWRDEVIRYLAQTGSNDAVAALQRLRQQYPANGWLLRQLLAAERARRMIGWTPPRPNAIVSFMANPQLRMVRSAHDLLALLQASVGRWGRRMREHDIVRLLWNEIDTNVWEPKEEASLRDALFDHLRMDLVDRPIVFGRELQLDRRTSPSGVAGRRLDIGVEAVQQDSAGNTVDRIAVVVEVKGSWNEDADDSLQSQLVDRYLSDHAATCGLYVVGWFQAPGWNPRDGRRTSGPWTNMNDAENRLNEFARAAQKRRPEIVVNVAVVDCSLR